MCRKALADFLRAQRKRNLELGAYIYRHRSMKQARSEPRSQRAFQKGRERMLEVAGNLSGGQQQMLMIKRGLMSRPKLLDA